MHLFSSLIHVEEGEFHNIVVILKYINMMSDWSPPGRLVFDGFHMIMMMNETEFLYFST